MVSASDNMGRFLKGNRIADKIIQHDRHSSSLVVTGLWLVGLLPFQRSSSTISQMFHCSYITHTYIIYIYIHAYVYIYTHIHTYIYINKNIIVV
jgi:hypothetical protein